MTIQTSKQNLIALLQVAYSAEMAAALAYCGHWRSVKDPAERAEIRKIEAEEWLHRREVGALLKDLLAHPRLSLELKYYLIGSVLGWFCHLAGWFVPMYGAGRLESKNYREYAQAAAYAYDCGHLDYTDCLLSMAETEWDHEAYFRGKVESHPWHRFVPAWEKLPARFSIRTSYRANLSPQIPEKLTHSVAAV